MVHASAATQPQLRNHARTGTGNRSGDGDKEDEIVQYPERNVLRRRQLLRPLMLTYDVALIHTANLHSERTNNICIVSYYAFIVSDDGIQASLLCDEE